MPVTLFLDFYYNSVAHTYDVYWYGWFVAYAYACLVHGTEKTRIERVNPDTGYMAHYLKVAEGDTIEFHGVDQSGTQAHLKSIYTAVSGAITESGTLNVSTTITHLT